MQRFLLFCGLFLVIAPFVSSIRGQQNPPIQIEYPIPSVINKVDLGKSSVNEVTNILGKPDKDETGDHGNNEKWAFKTKLKSTSAGEVFRILTYIKIDISEKTVFRFYDDKLVQIVLDYDLSKENRRYPTSLFSDQLAVDFLLFEGVTKNTKLSDFENQKQPAIPHVYNVLYTLIAVKSDRFYFVIMSNKNSKSFWRSITGRPTAELFPGYVAQIQIISGALENK